MRATIGRFAPSPTGPLHAGSLLAAVASYCEARAAGGQWLVRIEDLDPPREVPGASSLILHQLEAFGFEWDGEVRYQSRRQDAYEAALTALQQQGHFFSGAAAPARIWPTSPAPPTPAPAAEFTLPRS
jgi:glutamyl-Q tRNA(Asp) synthetase